MFKFLELKRPWISWKNLKTFIPDKPRRVGMMHECSTGELLARAAVHWCIMTTKGYSALKHCAALKGLTVLPCFTLYPFHGLYTFGRLSKLSTWSPLFNSKLSKDEDYIYKAPSSCQHLSHSIVIIRYTPDIATVSLINTNHMKRISQERIHL